MTNADSPPSNNPRYSPPKSGGFGDANLEILSASLLARGIETWAAITETSLLAFNKEVFTAARAKGAIVVAFPYDPRPEKLQPTDQQADCGNAAQLPVKAMPAGEGLPSVRIGAFASVNRYAALVRILKSVAKECAAATGHQYSGFRVAVNSRLPEKDLAGLAGLGHRGRSDIFLSYAYGPACILGVLLLPFDPQVSPSQSQPNKVYQDLNWSSTCGICEACASACPGAAITGLADDSDTEGGGDVGHTLGSNPRFTRQACIQHWMSTLEEPPESLVPAFEGRLYGCDTCILACPLAAGAWLADRPDGSSPALRAEALLLSTELRPGSLISTTFLTQAGDAELKAFFKHTALGFSWLGPALLRRNTERALRSVPEFRDFPK